MELGEPETLMSAFYDLLSELTAHLQERGYTVETELGGDDRLVRVNVEYVNRILVTIVSNIVKSAEN